MGLHMAKGAVHIKNIIYGNFAGQILEVE